jgi:hypothetical protein
MFAYAQSRHHDCADECLLLGVKRTLIERSPMSAYDLKRTLQTRLGHVKRTNLIRYKFHSQEWCHERSDTARRDDRDAPEGTA